MVARIIVDLLQFYLALLFVRIILTWFPINPWTRVGKAARVLAKVTDPVLLPVRRLIPPVRFGGMGLDLSPIVVLLALEILISVVSRMA